MKQQKRYLVVRLGTGELYGWLHTEDKIPDYCGMFVAFKHKWMPWRRVAAWRHFGDLFTANTKEEWIKLGSCFEALP